MTHLLDLSPELREEIFKYCNISDLKNLACCSSVYNKALKSILWHTVVVRRKSLINQNWTNSDGRKKLKNFKHTKTLQFINGLYAYIDKDNSHSYDADQQEMETKLHANLKKIINYCNRDLLDTFVIDLFITPGCTGNGPHINGECIEFACKSLTRLKRLTIKSFLLPIYVYEAIGKLKHLSVLNLDSTGTYNAGLCILFKRLSSLKTLNLSNTSATDEALSCIVKLKTLEELFICDCSFTDLGLSYISRLVTLRKLDISSCRNITDEGVVHLDNLVSLKELYMHHCNVTPTIGVLTSLQTLGLVGANVTDEGLRELVGKNKLLLEFNIAQTNVTDAALSCLSALTYLKKLNIGHTDLEDTGLYEISNLTGLHVLNLSHTNVTDASFKHLASLQSLKTLICDYTNITDAGVISLCSLEKLRELVLCYCVQITDVALSHLCNMISLEVIDVSHTSVTDAGLKHLSSLSSLRSLECMGNNVTEVGLGYFSSAIELIC